MSIENTECNCGEKITIRTGNDSKARSRRDGKQVIYTNNGESEAAGLEYNIFRCRGCGEPISETCKAANYE